MKQSPILGITMGDVCGIGPEIAVKALLRPETYDICHPIIVGDSRIVERGVRAVGAKVRSTCTRCRWPARMSTRSRTVRSL